MLWPELPLRVSNRRLNELIPEHAPALVEAVNRRDDFRCRFCGFRSLRFQSLIQVGDNPRDQDTMACACIFCEQTFSIETVARMHSGVLIHLPEIEQARLNRIAVECYVARLSNDGRLISLSKRVLDAFMARRAGAKARLGSDDVGALVSVLRAASAGAMSSLQAELKDIRLFPLDRRIRQFGGMEHNQFPQIVAYWRSVDGPYAPGNALPWLHGIELTPIG